MKPRRHLAGQVVLLTRRCFQRRFLLRPDSIINRIILFEIARSSTRHGQCVHGVLAMSNHIHQVSTDTTGNRSQFMRDTMREISRARNHNLDRRGSLWDGSPFGDTVLLKRETIERKLIYTWLNPVEAGLVRRVENWPGVKILPRHWGKTIRVKKPEGYYGRDTPDYVEFIPMPPPGYDDMTLEEVREHFEELLRKAEEKLLKQRGKKKVVGAIKVCQINPCSCPKTSSPLRSLNPRYACKDPAVLSRALRRHQAFLGAYQRSRLKWMKGKKVKFPCGTVQLKRRAPIRCKPPDDDEPGIFELTRTIG